MDKIDFFQYLQSYNNILAKKVEKGIMSDERYLFLFGKLKQWESNLQL